VPFRTRVQLFEALRLRDRALHGLAEDGGGFGGGDSVSVRVRRSHLVEDALATFAGLDPRAYKARFRVAFLRDDGGAEPGIDAGGLLKE